MQSIRNFFHTDTWWGKTIFIISLYILYLFLFYIGIPFLIALAHDSNFGGPFIFIFLFLIAPIMSFFIPVFIIKTFNVKRTILYTLHTIFVFLVPFIFVFIIAFLAFSHFSSIG